MIDEMIAFVRACLDEDERFTRSAIRPGHTGSWDFDEYDEDGQRRWHLAFDGAAPVLDDTSGIGPAIMRHIALFDPEWMLADIAAKRELVVWLAGELADDPYQEMPLWALRQLILPYADRPGYRAEWRPAE